MDLVFNKYQTPLTKELLNSLDKYVRDELLETIDKIELVKNLVSFDRKYAKDLSKNANNKIIVDIENPHILEDMDYFRQPVIHFQENGCYSFAHPSRHPKSEFQVYWNEQKHRCIEGYVRESDGEWITGYNYFYWNFSPILKAVVKNEKDETDPEVKMVKEIEDSYSVADRIEGFPDPWDGDYFYYHYLDQAEKKGKYGSVVKTRGRGYSFKGGSFLNRNFFFFVKSKSWAFASEKGDLTDDGLLSKAWDNMSFVNEFTPWRKSRHEKDTMMHKKASYKDLSTGNFRGYKSEIIGLTTKNNPERARGKRGKVILYEEAGRYPDLLTAWNIARPSMEQGRAVFGLMVAYGTGGTFTTASYGLEKLFYQGAGYRVYTTKNIYDKIKTNNSCAFYSPEYLNRHGCYDVNGNSDVIKALIEIFQGRYEVLKNTSDPMAIIQEKADRSITPQEAFAKITGSLFPVDDLKDYIAEIIPNQQNFTSSHSIGRLKTTVEGIEFVSDRTKYPIYDYPLSEKSNKEGAVQIFAHPIKINGQITKYRYISGIDPVDDDYSTTDSLPSIFIFDTFTNNIVAEYTGRLHTANEFYEMCIRLLEYYNAIGLFENDKKGLFAYFSHKNKLHLLADNPKILQDMDMATTKENYGNKRKGVNSSKRINQWGRRLQADWLTAVYKNSDDKEILNLQRNQSIAYIKELIAWNEDINTDRVSAMGMCMILNEEYKKYSDSAKKDTLDNSLEMDPYFMKNLPTYKIKQLKTLQYS